MIDGAKVITTDIACSNGVIHIIDSVILPEDKNIPAVADSAGMFKTLLAAAKAGGLVEALSGSDALTVFAPTDEAFGKLPEGTVETLLKPENKQKLVDILKYHVVAGRVYSDQALEAKSAKTLQGDSVGISIKGGAAMVNSSKLVKTDIEASNGVIHVIDSVLLPPEKGANAKVMIENAVASGAPLFNAGHHQACVEVYTKAMHKMMSADISSAHRNHLTSVMSQAGHQSCATDRAWTLRHGLDQMYTQIVHAQ